VSYLTRSCTSNIGITAFISYLSTGVTAPARGCAGFITIAFIFKGAGSITIAFIFKKEQQQQ